MKRAGITQDDVAVEASVTRTHVNHVLAGRVTSAKVIEAALRLLEKARRVLDQEVPGAVDHDHPRLQRPSIRSTGAGAAGSPAHHGERNA
jgi:hypothetical protein